MAPSKPDTVMVYVPACDKVVAICSGEVPVSIGPISVPSGALRSRMRSVEPVGMPSAVMSTVFPSCDGFGVKAKLASGSAPEIVPLSLRYGAPSLAPA